LFLCFGVADLDAAVLRVRAAGGTATPPTVQPYGRASDCTDNQGTPFALVEAAEDPQGAAPRQGHGDVVYLTMEVVDAGKARAFYASVLGWRFRPARVSDGWEVDNVVPMVGMKGGEARATTVPMYQVDDIEATVERIRARGGSATDPERQPYGVMSDCTDDQGTRFYLGQF
jgi:predicted enzyme related to lactoylglutathione lyase